MAFLYDRGGKLKKLLKILGSIVLVFVVVIAIIFAFLWFKYPDTVKGVINGIRLDSQQIEDNKQKNEEGLRDTIKDLGFEVSKEDIEKLNNGEISQDELKDILLGKDDSTEPDKPDEAPQNPDKNGQDEIQKTENVENVENNVPDVSETDIDKGKDENKPVQDEKDVDKEEVKPPPAEDPEKTDEKDAEIKKYEELIADEVAKLYVLKNQYIGQIEGLISEMKKVYATLPKEQQNLAGKTTVAKGFADRIAMLEAQCDVQVDAIVNEIKRLLTLCKRDTSLADSLYQSYVNEKEITKSYYINLYSD